MNEVLSFEIPKPSIKVAYMRMINYYSMTNVESKANPGFSYCWGLPYPLLAKRLELPHDRDLLLLWENLSLQLNVQLVNHYHRDI